ncbi:MAG TPA: hypothetical protein VHW09_08605 [Bryobacteraceae bacterium]|jgi:hypothetical protein|nr:hypothetical protein [Bryobacteraceae bacterium]
MNDTLKRRLLAGFYALAMAVMAASLTVAELRPKAQAGTCPNEGQPCNLVLGGGGYACTGGINGGVPIPGCGCDLSNFCTGNGR